MKFLCPIILTLSLLVPTQAGPVKYADVVPVMTGTGHEIDLSLRTLPPSGETSVAPVAARTPSAQGQAGTAAQSPGGSITGTPTQRGKVEVIELGEVTGTICDCGEIAVPVVGGGFPKWPLLALAAVPLAFLGGGGKTLSLLIPSIPIPTPPPSATPIPPATPIPEPLSLLLLGSGLVAVGLRRVQINREDERRGRR